MLYVIYAAEQIYQGLHGINHYEIEDCSSEREAQELGMEMSENLIDGYGFIVEQLESDIESYITEDMTDDDILQLCEDIYSDNILYDFWRIKTEIADKYTIEELDHMLQADPDSFIDDFCEH